MDGTVPWLSFLLLSASIIVPVMVLFWILGERMKNAGIVDVVWAASYGLLALVFAVTQPGAFDRKLMLLVAVLPWSFRLAIYLAGRFRREFPHEDGRYRAMRDAWAEKASMMMFWVFQFQGLLIILLSMPLAVIAADTESHVRANEFIGAALCSIGFAGEWAADEQLRQFKSRPDSKGKVCSIGLWRYSRHPNYFFEWIVWVGIFVIAAACPGGMFTAYAPLLMLYLLTKVSGVKMTEEHAAKSRGEQYFHYIKTTSAFIPWFKLKG